jgi:hypothetical protein
MILSMVEKLKVTYRTIHKYQLSFEDANDFMIPAGAEILAVQVQPQGINEGQPMLWAKVDVNQPEMKRRFEIVPTGVTFPADWKYVGTFQLSDGGFIGHVFEKP